MSGVKDIVSVPLEEWRSHPSRYRLADLREESAYESGHIPGAVRLTAGAEELPPLSEGECLLLYCKDGAQSASEALRLREQGVLAAYLEGGYLSWLREQLRRRSVCAADVERSIRKKFHRTLWSRFAKAVKDYQLVLPGDSIAVCISGGKDSMLMAKLFQELKRHDKFPFSVSFLVMDPGYSPANREILQENLRTLDVPAHVFSSEIFENVFHVEKSPCYLCARMRRGYLYKEAQKLGCNKIALGHHFDDVIETTLMGLLFGGQVQTMLPKLRSTNHPGMELIRPMYLIREADICRWRDYNDLYFLQCACKFTETTAEGTGVDPGASKRQVTKRLIRQLREESPQVEHNLFHAMEHINLGTALGWKDKNGFHSFLDDY